MRPTPPATAQLCLTHVLTRAEASAQLRDCYRNQRHCAACRALLGDVVTEGVSGEGQFMEHGICWDGIALAHQLG